MTYQELVTQAAVALLAAELQASPVAERDYAARAKRAVRLAELVVRNVLELTPPP